MIPQRWQAQIEAYNGVVKYLMKRGYLVWPSRRSQSRPHRLVRQEPPRIHQTIHSITNSTWCHLPARSFYSTEHLVEGVGAGAPVREEHAEAHGLEDAGQSTDGNGVEGALLGEDLGDELVLLVRCT